MGTLSFLLVTLVCQTETPEHVRDCVEPLPGVSYVNEDISGWTSNRIWRNQSGTKSVEALFVCLEKDKVVLSKMDGSLLRVPPKSLSKEDREAACLLAKWESNYLKAELGKLKMEHTSWTVPEVQEYTVVRYRHIMDPSGRGTQGSVAVPYDVTLHRTTYTQITGNLDSCKGSDVVIAGNTYRYASLGKEDKEFLKRYKKKEGSVPLIVKS